MTIELTAFGGAGEIGGNAFLLNAPGLRVMLDMGKRFGAAETMQAIDQKRAFDPHSFDRRPGFGDYFDSFQKVRTQNAVADLGALDLIPWQDKFPSLYRTDLGGVAGEAPVDIILVSHAHVDHCGLLGLVRPDLPVATSPESLATLKSIEETSLNGWETDYTDIRVRGGLERKEDGFGRISYKEDEHGFPRNFVTNGKIPEHGKWSIEFHHVDHSIQGAAAFILTNGDQKIVYTGDFRQHGLRPEKTRAFLKAAADPDVLIIEGTRVGDAHRHQGTDKETDVEAQVRSLIEAHEAAGNPPFVGIGYPPRDLDRFRSLHRVARSIGRRLLINTKQAHLLQSLRAAGTDDLPDWSTDPNVGVYLGTSKILAHPNHVPVAEKSRLTLAMERIGVPQEQWAELAGNELNEWEIEMLGGVRERAGNRKRWVTPIPFGDPHVVTPDLVRADPGGYLLSLNLFTMNNLFDLFPDRAQAGGLYIHSQTQPHNDDMEQDLFRLQRWLMAFNLNAPDHQVRRTHVSGHLGQEDLEHILDELKPKLLVPVHSERPDLTRERYEARTGRRALLLQWGQAHELAA